MPAIPAQARYSKFSAAAWPRATRHDNRHKIKSYPAGTASKTIFTWADVQHLEKRWRHHSVSLEWRTSVHTLPFDDDCRTLLKPQCAPLGLMRVPIRSCWSITCRLDGFSLLADAVSGFTSITKTKIVLFACFIRLGDSAC